MVAKRQHDQDGTQRGPVQQAGLRYGGHAGSAGLGRAGQPPPFLGNDVTYYDAEVDMSNPNLSHTQVIELVGHDKKVLDVGCATGYLALQLGNQGCKVSGVEMDPEAAEQARPYLEDLLVGDLNTTRLSSHFAPESFDVIVFADVLEHLLDPFEVLQDSLELLAPGGRIVLSVPNVAHGGVRLALLQGRWNYTDTGLLDRTHVRFFTYSTLLDLVQSAGLTVDTLRATVADPLAGSVSVDAERIPASMIEWVRSQPYALDYQYILSAHRRLAGDRQDVPGAAAPAVPLEIARSQDRFTEKARLEESSRHKVLTIRDHVVGLEARAAKAELAAALADAMAAEFKKDSELMRIEVDRVAEDREKIRRSTTWKVGRFITAPGRILRRRKGDS